RDRRRASRARARPPPALLDGRRGQGVGRAMTDSMQEALGFVQRQRRGLNTGLDLPDALATGALGLPRDARATVQRVARRLEGDYPEDDWGFDEDFADLVEPFFRFLYDRWWRVRVEGVSRVPPHGRVLLVANHAGILPW